MLIRKGHTYRLNLSEAQETLCARTAGACRWLWNLALEERTLAWTFGRHQVGFAAQCAELPGLKEVCPWLKEVPSHCLQQTLRDLDQAFHNFFAGRASYPVFRKKFRKDSFRFPDDKQFVIEESLGRVRLPKFGWTTIFNGKGKHALRLAGKAKNITVRREGRNWYLSVVCEGEVLEPRPVQGPPVGVIWALPSPLLFLRVK